MRPKVEEESSIVVPHLFVRESELEFSFCGVNRKNTRPSLSIQAKQLILDNPGRVNWVIQCSNCPRITSWEAILNVVESSVDEEVRISASAVGAIPGSRLDADSVTDGAQLLQLTISNNNAIFAQESNL